MVYLWFLDGLQDDTPSLGSAQICINKALGDYGVLWFLKGLQDRTPSLWSTPKYFKMPFCIGQ
jgi:hypothetical protein